MHHTTLDITGRDRHRYELHRTLTTRYPQESRLLFRVLADNAALVQSDAPLVDTSRPVLLPPCGSFREFRLLANPIVCRGGKRYGLVGRGALTDWLHRKAAAGGFTVCSIDMLRPQALTAKNDRNGATYQGCEYRGVLRVEDADAFAATLRNGIGPAKAFGFGLLVLQSQEVPV